MDTLKLILTNSKFWTALFLLIQTILNYFVPDFPPAIWAAIDALFAVVISVLLVGNVREQRAENKQP